MNGKKLSFLADESCDFGIVRALRAEGHDVLAIAEMVSRSDDRELIDFAAVGGRILITEDKDFGWWFMSLAQRVMESFSFGSLAIGAVTLRLLFVPSSDNRLTV